MLIAGCFLPLRAASLSVQHHPATRARAFARRVSLNYLRCHARAVLTAAFFTGLCLGHARAQANGKSIHAGDHVLIKFKPGTTAQLSAANSADPLDALVNHLKLPAGARLQEPHLNQWLRARAAKEARRAEKAGPNLDRF